MKYFFYKIENNVNKKKYYGVHKTDNINDGYLGSGILISKAIKKYGKENFNKEIVKFFDNSEEMYEFEKNFITEEIVSSDSTYNLTLGGRGGFSHIDNYGDKNPMKNPIIAKRCADSAKRSGNIKSEKKIKACVENFKKASILNTGKKRPEHAALMSVKIKEVWVENKERFRDALSSYFIVTSPTNETFRTNRLYDFCVERGLPYTSVWGTSTRSDGIPLKKGKGKGWKCVKE